MMYTSSYHLTKRCAMHVGDNKASDDEELLKYSLILSVDIEDNIISS